MSQISLGMSSGLRTSIRTNPAALSTRCGRRRKACLTSASMSLATTNLLKTPTACFSKLSNSFRKNFFSQSTPTDSSKRDDSLPRNSDWDDRIAHALPEQVLIYPSLEAASRQQLKSLGKSDSVSLKQCTIGLLL